MLELEISEIYSDSDLVLELGSVVYVMHDCSPCNRSIIDDIMFRAFVNFRWIRSKLIITMRVS